MGQFAYYLRGEVEASGSTYMAAAATLPGTGPNRVLNDGGLNFGHVGSSPSVTHPGRSDSPSNPPSVTTRCRRVSRR